MRVIICGGGTAGHIYPGLALAEELKSRKVDILYVGSSNGIETKLVPSAGFSFKSINIKGFKRKISIGNLKTIYMAVASLFSSRKIIVDFKPDVVVGFGGYASGPIAILAGIMKIPLLIHEQNAVPGLTNKLLGRLAGIVAVSYPGSEVYFQKTRNIQLTGNPVRSIISKADRLKSMEEFGLDNKRKTILIFGGSRGARKINESVIEAYPLFRGCDDMQIIHITGDLDFEFVKEKIFNQRQEEDKLIYKRYPYIENIGKAYSCSDLVVCRAGASTIAEITNCGLPAILIPYPYSTDNHQEKNARILEQNNAGIIVLDKDLNGQLLFEEITRLFSSSFKLLEMKKNSKSLSNSKAAEMIARLVFELGGKENLFEQ